MTLESLPINDLIIRSLRTCHHFSRITNIPAEDDPRNPNGHQSYSTELFFDNLAQILNNIDTIVGILQMRSDISIFVKKLDYVYSKERTYLVVR